MLRVFCSYAAAHRALHHPSGAEVMAPIAAALVAPPNVPMAAAEVAPPNMPNVTCSIPPSAQVRFMQGRRLLPQACFALIRV